IRFLAVLPKQLIEDTKIGALASSSYAAWQGITPREFMSRYEVPLDAQKVAGAIVGGLRGDVAAGVTAIAVSGKGVEPLGCAPRSCRRSPRRSSASWISGPRCGPRYTATARA